MEGAPPARQRALNTRAGLTAWRIDTSTFLGYTSTNTGESVSWGLEGLVNDFGIGTMAAKLAKDPEIHKLIQEELDRVNAKYAQVEQVKKFAILDHDLSQPTGELTPTLKVKRNVVNEKYKDVFDALYAG